MVCVCVCVCVSSATCIHVLVLRKEKDHCMGYVIQTCTHACIHTHMYTGSTQTWDKVIFMLQLQLSSHSTIILYKLQQWSWRKWKESTRNTIWIIRIKNIYVFFITYMYGSILKKHCVLKISLPSDVDAPSLQAFKSRLDEIWQDKKFLHWVCLPTQWPQCFWKLR